jgi:hypothetical protein
MRASPAVKFVQNAPFGMQRAAMAATKITVHIGGSALDYQEPSTPRRFRPRPEQAATGCIFMHRLRWAGSPASAAYSAPARSRRSGPWPVVAPCMTGPSVR